MGYLRGSEISLVYCLLLQLGLLKRCVVDSGLHSAWASQGLVTTSISYYVMPAGGLIHSYEGDVVEASALLQLRLFECEHFGYGLLMT